MRNSQLGLFAAILIILGIWELAYLAVGNSLLLPGPITTFKRLGELCTNLEFYLTVFTTFSKAVLGLALALIAGVLAGFSMGLSRTIYTLFRPLVIVMQSVPIVSWLALAVLWWGIGFRSPVYIVFLTLFPIITLNIVEGVRNVDVKLVEMAKVFSVSKSRIFKDIYFGSTLPFIASSLRISVGVMWKSVAVAEFMVGTTGIGRKIFDAKSYLETTDVFAYTLVLVILGILSEKMLDQFAKRTFRYVDKS
ncbi:MULTISPECIES: ABC transporter permease [Kosmotoga]|jgi:NitT/TauT family transport system permease protein|uniref:Binding-protein-dependent transport systems inner membrane component n=1 Tax=Kosmotoga olearia (strain ATCC BAA-1733 / DSM 21960 / TBF 19.5.1) TaxID=521045 RepID=C5CEP2_KOSOT|nr:MULTISPECIES: ABC transporter permease [Kosmotoga]ACR80222.1 binding-protein-dependent transport systems inner membrane component [Kosmotoga olearia TBF 19.5.1]MDK2952964.1 NitT/TauT family transport system permease protein [Kosmotoga sp.]